MYEELDIGGNLKILYFQITEAEGQLELYHKQGNIFRKMFGRLSNSWGGIF